MTIKVLRGNPTLEELAAVVSVLPLAGASAPPPAPERPSAWTSRSLSPRTPHTYGTVGWLAPALPR
ncbi:acyl-CoA carboxylase subunit epsilon [Streptomyces sp. KR55]|uniref:acyl-CoA carboxylase subunit epsilon n=1 Tax=Streptomyces sp. KR55 TaxID=3457425 RepID=UPI003FD591D7